MTHVLRFLVMMAALAGIDRCAAQSASPEELTVRALYSQLVIGSDVQAISRDEAPGSLSVQLSNFRAGPLSAIMAERIEDLVTIPSGEVLSTGPGRWSFNDRKLCAVTHASWKTLDPQYGAGENWRAPFSEFLKNRPVYDRFVNYRVRISYQGKSREYKALALFSAADQRATVIDYIADGATILKVGAEKDFPHCLNVFTDVLGPATKSTATAYVESLRIAQCVTEPYTTLCCDPRGGKCGLPARSR